MRPVAVLTALLALAGPARAAEGPTRRFAIVAGASLGGPGRTPLRYAASDARDVARVLRRLGGVALDDLRVIEEPDADELRGALRAVAAETERARRAGQRIELFVYYSGHSDEEGLLLGRTRLPYPELRRALDGVPADVRVAILDSCASGALTRAKGGVHRPPFLVDDASRVTGHAFLTSSAADEAAQESDRLRASFFTHALLTGLRGAADASGDGVVTLNEAYQFAFRETLAGTETSQAGPQHATYDIGLVGSGDVVMTDLRRADGILVVPEAVEGRVFVRNAAGALVVELRKAAGARVELALEEGHYDVRVVREASAVGTTLSVAGSSRVVLDVARLRPIPLDRTAARGDLALRGGPESGVVGPDAPPPAPWAAGYTATVRGGGALSRRVRAPTGLLAELALAAWYDDIVGVELSSGYQRIDGHTEGRMPYSGGAYMDEVRDVVTTVPTRLTLSLGLPARPVRPYLLAGAGANWVRVERFSLHPVVNVPNPPHRLWDEGFHVSFHAGAGVVLWATRHVAATLELRYVFGPTTTFLQERNLDMSHVSATAGVTLAL